jgi:hypothetical protein
MAPEVIQNSDGYNEKVSLFGVSQIVAKVVLTEPV